MLYFLLYSSIDVLYESISLTCLITSLDGRCRFSDKAFAEIGSEQAGDLDCDMRVYVKCLLDGGKHFISKY